MPSTSPAAGFEVVGVDFAPRAIKVARKRALTARSPARFLAGDVTDLARAGVTGQFDLILDVGCYHAVAEEVRTAYAAQVVAFTKPGADFYLAGISDPPASWRLLHAKGVDRSELVYRFGDLFEVAEETDMGQIGDLPSFVLYHLVKDSTSPTSTNGLAQRSWA